MRYPLVEPRFAGWEVKPKSEKPYDAIGSQLDKLCWIPVVATTDLRGDELVRITPVLREYDGVAGEPNHAHLGGGEAWRRPVPPDFG